MTQLQPVLWSKGVLLSPQHLQTQDRFFESVLAFQVSTLNFNPWGFSRLELDHQALSAGAVAVVSAAGMFADGLLFDVPTPDAAPPPKPLEGCWEPDQNTLGVYLAIPEYRVGELNVSSTVRDRATRYIADLRMLRDETTGLSEKPIQVARKNLRLLVEGEAVEGHSLLPVTRVQRLPSGEYQFDPHFVPPLLSISANGHIMSIVRRLVEILSTRSRDLSGTRRERNQSLADFTTSDIASFWLLYTINTHFPRIRHLFETRHGHPAELFAELLSLAGALSAFSDVIHPRQFPVYAHDDLSQCFSQLDATIRQLLETVVPANFVALPLREVQPLISAVALDQERYLTAPQFYLAVRTDVRPTELQTRVPHIMKVGAADRIDRLVRQALPGVSLTYTPRPPSAIPVKLDWQYFLLGKTGAEWDAIVRARNLAVYVPAELPNPQMELVLVLPAPR